MLAWIDRHAALFLVVALCGMSFLGAELESTQSTIAHTSKVFARSTKESVETRVTTVNQRCDLTYKILEVLVKDDPRRVIAFRKSYLGCEKQLARVVAINARTPSPTR